MKTTTQPTSLVQWHAPTDPPSLPHDVLIQVIESGQRFVLTGYWQPNTRTWLTLSGIEVGGHVIRWAHIPNPGEDQ